MIFSLCPRCNCQGFEHLKTYAHCVNCEYVEDYESETIVAIPTWALNFIEKRGQEVLDVCESICPVTA